MSNLRLLDGAIVATTLPPAKRAHATFRLVSEMFTPCEKAMQPAGKRT
jgi:hypothetical protein